MKQTIYSRLNTRRKTQSNQKSNKKNTKLQEFRFDLWNPKKSPTFLWKIVTIFEIHNEYKISEYSSPLWITFIHLIQIFNNFIVRILNVHFSICIVTMDQLSSFVYNFMGWKHLLIICNKWIFLQYESSSLTVWMLAQKYYYRKQSRTTYKL